MLLREAYVTDDVSNTVEGALTVCRTAPSSTQLETSGVVNMTMIRSHASNESAQSLESGVVGMGALAATVTAPTSRSDVVVTQTNDHPTY